MGFYKPLRSGKMECTPVGGKPFIFQLPINSKTGKPFKIFKPIPIKILKPIKYDSNSIHPAGTELQLVCNPAGRLSIGMFSINGSSGTILKSDPVEGVDFEIV